MDGEVKYKILGRFIKRAEKLLSNKFLFNKVFGKAAGTVLGKYSKLFKAFPDFPTMEHMAFDFINGNYRAYNKKNIVLIVAGLLYLLNPMDIVPDFILTFGLIDDAIVLRYVAKKIKKEIESYRAFIGSLNEES